MKIPKWTDFVKTSTSKDLAPLDADWLYIRCAAVARRIFMNPNVGVRRLTQFFGDKKRNGCRPNHHNVAS